MTIRRGLTAACLFAALAAPATAGPDREARARRNAERAVARTATGALKTAQRAAKALEKARRNAVRQFAGGKFQVEGDDLNQNIERVTEALTWHDELDEARRAAVEANKPILYVQALGDLSGLL